MAQTTFKYHPNVWNLNIFKRAPKKRDFPLCRCCGNPTEYFIDHIYSEHAFADEQPDCICPECVASGRAAKQYDCSFIAEAECSCVGCETATHELMYCTPGYKSHAGEHWLACCGDYCAFIGYVGKAELDALGIGDEAFSRGFRSWRHVLTKNGTYRGYLFRCLHCQSYHVWVDCE